MGSALIYPVNIRNIFQVTTYPRNYFKKKPRQNARANRGRTREINNDNNGAPSSVNTYF